MTRKCTEIKTAACALLMASLGACAGLPTIPGTSHEPAVYYVDGSQGSDAAKGSQSGPWRTIQKAADVVRAGDTVVVLPGQYDERVRIRTSGAAGAPISFEATGIVQMRGFTVKSDFITLKGFAITDTPDDETDGVGIFIQGSYCVIEDNYVYFATRGGIRLSTEPGKDSQTTNCIVRNNRLNRNSQWGVMVMGQDHFIERNEIWGTIQYHPKWANPPPTVDADGIRFFGSGHIIRGNYIHDIPVETPENRDPHVDCFQTWQDSNHTRSSDTIIEQNRCSNIQTDTRNTDDLGSGFTLTGPTGLTIRNNVISADVGVRLYASSDVLIVNNDFIGNPAGNPVWYPVGAASHDSAGTAVENNIFYNQPSRVIDFSGSSATAVSHNLAYNTDGSIPPFPDGALPDQTLWGVNPLFANPMGSDYHLLVGSAGIDAGMSVAGLQDDFDGVARPQGAGFDIGAYEFPQ